ncbi:hypothetical protein [Klebsiella pneumoniae]|nr:hypothetical protein [Klebsiella pneumoniae]
MIHSFEEKNLEKLFTSGKSQSGLPTDITNSLKRALMSYTLREAKPT